MKKFLALSPIAASLVFAFAAAAPAAAQCSNGGPYVAYYGNPFLPKVNVLSGTFAMGQPTVVRLEAGAGFTEGLYCVVWQANMNNQANPMQAPGIAGDLYIDPARPFFPAAEGMLSGGVNAGNSPTFTINIPFNPALCGFELAIQGYVTTEALTNPTFSQLLVGTLH